MEKRESLYSVGGNVSGFSHCGKEYGGFSRKLKLKLPHDPAIPPLGIYLKTTKTLIQKNTCIPRFIATLFIIGKIWEQYKCPSTGEWIEKMWSIYTMEYC